MRRRSSTCSSVYKCSEATARTTIHRLRSQSERKSDGSASSWWSKPSCTPRPHARTGAERFRSAAASTQVRARKPTQPPRCRAGAPEGPRATIDNLARRAQTTHRGDVESTRQAEAGTTRRTFPGAMASVPAKRLLPAESRALRAPWVPIAKEAECTPARSCRCGTADRHPRRPDALCRSTRLLHRNVQSTSTWTHSRPVRGRIARRRRGGCVSV